jgi:DNA helicase HerA-like ATPase
MEKQLKANLYADTPSVGMLKGFSPLPHQLEVDVIVPHDDKRGLPGFGEFLLIEFSPTEAIVGRVSRYYTSGQLVTDRGDAYLADLAKAEDKVPAPIMRQMLRYNLKIQLLGVLRITAEGFDFQVGQRSFASLGANVRAPSDAALSFLCNVGLEKHEHTALLGHLAFGQTVHKNVPVRFSIDRLKGKRTFVFARAGYGKSNLIKYLVSQLYSAPPEVGLLIFDPEGEDALRDNQGRPGLFNIPSLRQRVSLYTPRPVDGEGSSAKRGDVAVDFGDFYPQDVVAAFIPPEKQDMVFANLLRGMKIDAWKKLVELLARDEYRADDKQMAQIMSYRSRGKDKEDSDVILGAVKNNLVHHIRRLHRGGAVLGKNLIEELRQNRVVIVDTSLLGSEESLGICGLLLRRIFYHNVRFFTDTGRQPIRCLSVLEEAQTVLGNRHFDDRNIFVRWVKEGRKYGLGTIIVTQQPGAIHDQIISQGDNFFALHLLNENDLQTLKRHNAYYSDEILNFIRAEPIVGNCYFWSAPKQPFVLPVRIRNFEEAAPTPQQQAAAKQKPTSERLEQLVEQCVRESIVADPTVWMYLVKGTDNKKDGSWVAVSADYLQSAVERRVRSSPHFLSIADAPQWLESKLPQEIKRYMTPRKVRTGYAVLEGNKRQVWVLPKEKLKLKDGKQFRQTEVLITDEL